MLNQYDPKQPYITFDFTNKILISNKILNHETEDCQNINEMI
jgi:hypothetical protein